MNMFLKVGETRAPRENPRTHRENMQTPHRKALPPPNAVVKCTKTLTHIKSLNADIMFIQEIHLRNSDQLRFNRP